MKNFLLCLVAVIFVGLLERSEAGWLDERNDVKEFRSDKNLVPDKIAAEPVSGLCHCQNATCTCCVKEFKAKICTILSILEVQKYDEVLALLEFSLIINGRPVLTHEFPSDMIPPLCYHWVSGVGVCGKITTKDENNEFLLCSTIQFIYQQTIFKEVDLKCRVIHSDRIIETTPVPSEKYFRS